MRRLLAHRPSPGMIVAVIALVLAAGGTAFATNTVSVAAKKKHADVKQDTKLVKKLAKSLSVKFAKNAGHATSANSATNATNATSAGHASSADTATNAGHATNADTATNAGHATSADSATRANSAATTDGFVIFPRKHADLASDEASAPKIPLGSLGPFSFYGKCYLSAGNGFATIFVEVPPGVQATMSTEDQNNVGDNTGNYLTSDTLEDSRKVEEVDSGAPNNTTRVGNSDADFRAASSDIVVTGVVGLAEVKRGTPPQGDGPFGPGDGCLFGGTVFGA
jgi:hypothetical protein